MKCSRAVVTLVVAQILISVVTCFAGEYLSKWNDWTKMDDFNVYYRVRCHKLDEISKKYAWDVEVENRMDTAAKIGVVLTKAGESAPSKGLYTWPVSNGGRHVFSNCLCESGPGEKVAVWLRNFTSDRTLPTVSTLKETKISLGNNDSATGKTFKAAGKEWMVGKVDIDWTATQDWIKGLGSGWRAPTKDELQELFNEVGQKCPIGEDFVWAEARDANSAWHFSFYYRETRWGYFDDHSRYGRGVAIRTL